MECNTAKSIHLVFTLLAIYQDLQLAQGNLLASLVLLLLRNLKQVYCIIFSAVTFIKSSQGFSNHHTENHTANCRVRS